MRNEAIQESFTPRRHHRGGTGRGRGEVDGRMVFSANMSYDQVVSICIVAFQKEREETMGRRNTCRVNGQNISKLDEKHKAQICWIQEIRIYKKGQNSSQQDGFKFSEKDKNMRIIVTKMGALSDLKGLSFSSVVKEEFFGKSCTLKDA